MAMSSEQVQNSVLISSWTWRMLPVEIDVLLINILDQRLHLLFIMLIHQKHLGSIWHLMITNIGVLLHQDFLNFAFRSEIELKCGALSKFTGSLNRSSHLLDNLFTNRKTKAGALLVSLWVLGKLAKVHEKVIETFFRNSYACILNRQTKTYEALLPSLYFLFALFFLLFSELLNNFGHRQAHVRPFLILDQFV